MSFRQAFHTSCRNGLSGHAGFQFNAASAGLDDQQLARIAADHVGYQIPPDASPEPGADEIAQLPVALRYAPVDGVGPVVSRTAYVGREFRGVDGESDSGRFGNYFSHVVVGDEPTFDGLLPIELWQAPHWSTSEVDGTELPPLEGVEPGPLDLDGVLDQLRLQRPAALAAIADGALRAVLDGPRLVVVEADPGLAAPWVAWACLTLPPDRVSSLTFSTFDGRPRVSESMRVCVTTPACDVDFPSYELGSAVIVVDTASPPALGSLSLYARVLELLAGQGGEAVSAATRALPPGLDLAAAGAELALSTGRTALADAADVASVLAAVRRRLGGVPAARLAELTAALPSDDGSAAALAEWAGLYADARHSPDPEAGELVDEALGHLLDGLGDPAVELPEVAADAPSIPSAGVLVKWLGLVSAAAGTEKLGPVLAVGLRLGLVGCNTALDKELATSIASGLGDPAVQSVYDSIASAGNALIVESVALELAAAAGAGRGIDQLRRVAADPRAREAIRANAERAEDFESVVAWELLNVEADRARRPATVASLAGLAEAEGHERAIRGLYGEGGPQSPDEHAELLAGWVAAGREAPARDYEAGLDCLAKLSFSEGERPTRLFDALAAGPAAVRGDPEYIAWGLRFDLAPRSQGFRVWAETAVRAGAQGSGLSRSRGEDLEWLAARVAVECVDESDYGEGLSALLLGMGEGWPLQLGDALGRLLGKIPNPEKRIAKFFVAWYGQKRDREVLLETALPRATRDTPLARLEEVGEKLSERGQPIWQEWLEEHPPRRAVSRAVRGVFRRGDDG
ncbi:MAG TPA: hypothetical protein VMS60_04610 [Solirubrobacterales bacterium]|nr:hypothetical protein [Solirubrobacterales bacterium]